MKSRCVITLLFFFAFVCGLANGAEERSFEVLNAANGLADNSVQLVKSTKAGRMVITTTGNVNFYNNAYFSNAYSKHEYHYDLPAYRGNSRLYFDSYHHLWLKDTHQLTCLDLMTEQFIEQPAEVFKEFGMDEQVNDLFVDSLGHVWLLTKKGLWCHEKKSYFPVLKGQNLQDVEVFGKLVLFFYDNGEEVGFTQEDTRMVHQTLAYEGDRQEKYTQMSTLLRHQDGFFQIRSSHSESILLYFNVPQQKWTTIMEVPYLLKGLALHGSLLYVPCRYGYWIYNIATGEKRHHEKFRLSDGRNLVFDVNTLEFDRQGGMWVGTERRGLLYSKPYASPFKVIDVNHPQASKYARVLDPLEQSASELKGMDANCMFKDSRGWVWFGTTMGIYLYTEPQAEPIVITKKEGLYNNVIHTIVEDQRHHVWVGTSNGITFIQVKNDKLGFINSFGTADGVPSESFINSKAALLPDGQIVMKSLDHIVVFNPAGFRNVNEGGTFHLYPKLVRLSVNGTLVEQNEPLDDQVIIDRAFSRVSDINVDASQNSMTLVFSGLNYFRPLQTFYRVRVNGLDDMWRIYSHASTPGQVDDQGLLRLSLIGLKPGHYEVEIQASMFPDVWQGTSYVWNVNVEQPWWRASGVFWFLGIVIVVLFSYYFVLYIRNTRMRTRRNAEEDSVIKKIRMFVERCTNDQNDVLSPTIVELFGDHQFSSSSTMSNDFVDVMEKVVPYVQSHADKDLTMRQISLVAGIPVKELYSVISNNLYKSPRILDRNFRLRRAADMLAQSDMCVEDIAIQCRYESPNYFMGNFYHLFKMTPLEYRKMHQG